MDYLIYLILVLVGVCMGSFAGASVWRLRARQLVSDKKAGEKVSAKELKKLEPLTKKGLLDDRSRCLHCGYELHWYDLIPVISWLTLRGKCRQCRKPIGYFELIIELSVAAFFVGSFVFWPFGIESWQEISRFVVWLAAGVALAILFAYDAKWFLLPDIGTLLVAAFGAIISTITIVTSDDPLASLLNVLGAVTVLGGLYWLLYVVSKGRWIGFGDVKLGAALGLLLADWRLALVALFSANIIGTLLVLPGMATGKLQAKSRIPFGPLLIVGTILAQFFGTAFVDWYSAILLL